MLSKMLSSKSSARIGGSRDNNFDFLRFVFASLVLFYHCFPLLLGAGARHLWPGEAFATAAGGTSVDCFFIISGFLVTASWMRRPHFGLFFKKRALRIYPAFILASFFCAFVVGPLGTVNIAAYWHHFQFAKFLLYLVLLPADVVGPDMATIFVHQPYPAVIDGSFWTLRYEFGMYLLTAGLGSLGLFRERRYWAILLLFVVLCLLYGASETASLTFVSNHEMPWLGNPAHWVRLAAYFFAGIVFCLFRERIPTSPVLFGLSVGFLLLTELHPSRFGAAMPLFASYALFWIAFQPRIKLEKFARYGDFSYGIYLFAFPIQQLLVHYFQSVLTPYRLLGVAFPLTLLCAVLSWHFVEKPCLNLKSKSQT